MKGVAFASGGQQRAFKETRRARTISLPSVYVLYPCCACCCHAVHPSYPLLPLPVLPFLPVLRIPPLLLSTLFGLPMLTSFTFPVLLAVPFVLVLVPTLRTVLPAIPVVFLLFSLFSSFSFYCYIVIICLFRFYHCSCSTSSTAAHRTRCRSAHSLRIHHLFVIRILLCTLRLCPFRSDEVTATPHDVYMRRFPKTRY